MKKLIYLLLAILLFSCAAKKNLKRAIEYEKQGMYLEAANFYYLVVLKKGDKIPEAKIGLRNSGGLYLENQQDFINKSFLNGDFKKSVYSYQSLNKNINKYNKLGAGFEISQNINQVYTNAVEEYVEQLYKKSKDFILKRNYNQAKLQINEIKKFKSSYKDITNLDNIAKWQPVYDKAENLFSNKDYVNAYKYWNKINLAVKYKDVEIRLESCLSALYSKGNQYLFDEKFALAEKVFSNILSLNSEYKETKILYNEAKYEPVYRNANYLAKNLDYVSAYEKFSLIINKIGNYKDCMQLREKMLELSYNDAKLLLDQEQFYKAEQKILRIIKLNPDYKNIKSLYNTAHYEPIYRQAFAFYDEGAFKKSYYEFEKIPSTLYYKETNKMIQIALEKATVRMCVVFSNSNILTSKVLNNIEVQLKKIDSKFIKIEYLSFHISRLRKSYIEGFCRRNKLDYVVVLGGKFNSKKGKVKGSEIKTAFVKPVKESDMISHTLSYREFLGKSVVNINGTINIINSYGTSSYRGNFTGKELSKVFYISGISNIHYSFKTIYPGKYNQELENWVINTNPKQYNKFQQGLRNRNRKSLKSHRKMEDKVIDTVSKQIAEQLNSFVEGL